MTTSKGPIPMEMTSHNFSDDHKLINFNVPIYLIKNFDQLMRFKRVSRTSMLIRLMEDYLRSETKQMKEDGSLNEMLNTISKNNREDLKQQLRNDLRQIKEEWEPPMIPISNDFDINMDWEDRFRDF